MIAELWAENTERNVLSKAAERETLQQKIAEFLRNGGKIQKAPESGRYLTHWDKRRIREKLQLETKEKHIEREFKHAKIEGSDARS